MKMDQFIEENKRHLRHIVEHKEYGKGVVINIGASKIKVFFEETTQDFNIPRMREELKFLTPIIDESDMFNRKYSIFDYRPVHNNFLDEVISKDVLDAMKEAMPRKRTTQPKVHLGKEYDDYKKVRKAANLIGNGARDIEFSEPNDFIDVLAYLSYPGIAKLHADVPDIDGKVETFRDAYPTSDNMTIRKTNPEGYSCMYTIFIYEREGMPIHLDMNQTPKGQVGKDDWAGAETRVIRTLFVSDLIENRGFEFLNGEQDIEKIYNLVPDEFKDTFINKVKQLDDIYGKDICSQLQKENEYVKD